MPMKNLLVSLVLDRSGSMAHNWPKTIDAVNEYLNSLKSNGADTLVNVTVFDSASIDRVRVRVPAKDLEPLKEDEFPPRASTPLLDAVGRAIIDLMERVKRDDEGVALVVMTDGQENASREHKLESLKSILATQQTKDNWLVIFLGEGLDAWSQASGLGAWKGNSMQYSGQNVGATLSSVARATEFYASGSSRPGTASNDVNHIFNEAARAAARGDDVSVKVKTIGRGAKAKEDKAPEVKETPVKEW